MKKWILCLLIIIVGTFNFTEKHLIDIRDHPHKLGHLMGKTKLTDLHSDWIKDVWIRHIPIMGHRGSYKTTAITEVGCIWWLLFNPLDRISLIRKPYMEAARTLYAIRRNFELDDVRALFKFAHGAEPQFRKKQENSLEFTFKKSITKEGSIDAYGIENVKTGTHYEKSIGDDIITLEDRLSKAKRDRTKQGILELITNIMDPGRECGFTGTPWHKDDGWTLIPKPKKFTVYQTGILTPEQIADKQNKTTKPLFACNYKLEHIASDETIFKDPIYDRWDWKVPSYAHLDAKYGGECTNALTIMGRRSDNKIQSVGFIWEDHIKDIDNEIIEKCRKYRVKRIYNEINPDKGYAASLLRSGKLNVKEYHEKMNKHIKIVAYLKEYWNDIIWAMEADDRYLEQIVDYIEGHKPDDAPDSGSSLLREHFYKDVDLDALYRM